MPGQVQDARGRVRRIAIVAAVLYPLSLLLLVLLLGCVGEGSWLSCLGLYAPRIVFGAPLPVLVSALLRLRLRRLLLTQLIALLILVFPLMGFVLPGPTAARTGSPIVRVLSYNVDHAFGGPEKVAAEIFRFQPDVVLVQKLDANQEPLARLLKERYPNTDMSHGFLLATRHPIVSRFDPDPIRFRAGPASARFVAWTIFTPLGAIAFYSVHPTSARIGLSSLIRGGPGKGQELDAESELRSRQIQQIAARADRETVPVVIAGDTNVPGLSPMLRRYLGRYREGFTEAGWGFGYTFPSRWLFPWMRLDRIMVSEPLGFLGFEVGASTVSDHFCVVADLQQRSR